MTEDTTQRSQEDANFYRASRLDIILISLILLFSIVPLLWTRHESSRARSLLIYQNNRLLKQIELGKDRIISLCNGRMQVKIRDNKARVIKSDCPHHICMNMGWIQYSGQAIACVPNRVLLEIKSPDSPLWDAVAY